ncbi:hypothetical protein NONO_c19990 [Nocardia nova SH22a]|uniref:Uncharacterized protein n=1 Tax=Nocardia nova SH22a TaxID=1415166 RepID=W5TC86_9NOCA|nr:hypothetical protein NONO_c19990 [Nocardia nova SH22a]
MRGPDRPFDIERTGSFVVALLVGIGFVSLIVISMYAVVVAVWSARLRSRYATPARRASSRARLVAKTVVSQSFGPERAAADAMR